MARTGRAFTANYTEHRALPFTLKESTSKKMHWAAILGTTIMSDAAPTT